VLQAVVVCVHRAECFGEVLAKGLTLFTQWVRSEPAALRVEVLLHLLCKTERDVRRRTSTQKEAPGMIVDLDRSTKLRW